MTSRRGMRVKVMYESPIPAPVSAGVEVARIEVTAPDMEPIVRPLKTAQDVGQLAFFGRIKSAIDFIIFGSSSGALPRGGVVLLAAAAVCACWCAILCSFIQNIVVKQLEHPCGHQDEPPCPPPRSRSIWTSRRISSSPLSPVHQVRRARRGAPATTTRARLSVPP